MSVRVDLASLHAQIARFGPQAFLVSTSADGPPHVSSVLVTVDGENLVMGAGRTTRANAAARPVVSIVWSSAVDDEYCLIVDATASDGPEETFVVRPTSAVLHRLAGASNELAQCLPVDAAAAVRGEADES